MIVASTRTAIAIPTPMLLIVIDSARANAENTTTMIRAAPVMTPAVRDSPSATDVARCAAERGARRLTDGTALAERPYGDDEWLESEILASRGGAVLVEPAELRARIAARAKALAKELGVERLRAPA